MNTVILVSVLSTLGVVAMAGTIVIAFMKLNRRVDDEISYLHNRITTEIKDISTHIDFNRNQIDRRFEDCYSFIDSRYDNLDNKICGKNCKCNPSKKQLLTD